MSTSGTEYEIGNPTRLNLRSLPPHHRDTEVCWYGQECEHEHASNQSIVIPDDLYEHLPGWTAQSPPLQRAEEVMPLDQ